MAPLRAIYGYICSTGYIYIYTLNNIKIYTCIYAPLRAIVINDVPGGPPWPEFGMHLTTTLTKIFSCPKGISFNQIKQF